MKHIYKCSKCNNYTMKEICKCGNKTIIPKPLKYSPDDRLGAYRRKIKLNEYMNRGLL